MKRRFGCRLSRQHNNLGLQVLIDQRAARRGLDAQHIAIEASQLGESSINRIPLKALGSGALLFFKLLDRSLGLARLRPFRTESQSFLQCRPFACVQLGSRRRSRDCG